MDLSVYFRFAQHKPLQAITFPKGANRCEKLYTSYPISGRAEWSQSDRSRWHVSAASDCLLKTSLNKISRLKRLLWNSFLVMRCKLPFRIPQKKKHLFILHKLFSLANMICKKRPSMYVIAMHCTKMHHKMLSTSLFLPWLATCLKTYLTIF